MMGITPPMKSKEELEEEESKQNIITMCHENSRVLEAIFWAHNHIVPYGHKQEESVDNVATVLEYWHERPKPLVDGFLGLVKNYQEMLGRATSVGMLVIAMEATDSIYK